MQAASSLGGLLFGASLLFALAQTARLLVRAARRQPLAGPARLLAAGAAVHLVVLLAAGFAGRADERLPAGAEKCFDDWCLSVAGARTAASLGGRAARGRFVVVDLVLHNAARRAALSGSAPRLSLVDAAGRTFPPSVEGLAGLAAAGQSPPPLGARLQPGERLPTAAVFDVPADVSGLCLQALEGAGPNALVPFDESSPLHGRVLQPLPGP